MNLYLLQKHGFSIIIYLTWFLYFAILLGLSANAPQYLDDLQYYVKMYVSLFLIVRFNPFTRVRFNELDGKIAFSAGVFLLTTTAINSFLEMYLDKLKGYIHMFHF
jgi:hypothetical protein